jgi:hypothetical protein
MSPLLGRLGPPLEVDDRVTLARLSPSRLADRDIKRLMDTTVQSAIPIPQLKIQMRRAFRRQIFRQSLPLAAGREHIEDSVEDFALVDRPPPSAAPGRAGGMSGATSTNFLGRVSTAGTVLVIEQARFDARRNAVGEYIASLGIEMDVLRLLVLVSRFHDSRI